MILCFSVLFFLYSKDASVRYKNWKTQILFRNPEKIAQTLGFDQILTKK